MTTPPPESPAFDTTKYLADPAELARRSGKPATDLGLLDALRRASDRFRGAVHHPVHLVTDDEFWASGDGGAILQLPAAPILGTPTVDLEGAVAVTDFRTGRRTGMLQRAAGWPHGLEMFRVVYTHGYAEIPGDVQDAVMESAESTLAMAAGVESVSTGSESVKFVSALAAGGTSALWESTVAKYIIGGNGDRS